jgi:hypothetical protein
MDPEETIFHPEQTQLGPEAEAGPERHPVLRTETEPEEIGYKIDPIINILILFVLKQATGKAKRLEKRSDWKSEATGKAKRLKSVKY